MYNVGKLYGREIQIKHDKLISEQFNISKFIDQATFL